MDVRAKELAHAVTTRIEAGAAADALLAKVDRVRAGEKVDRGITTGIPGIDTSGLRPGDLWVAAGRASMGEAIMATSLARAAARSGVGTLLFPFEIGGEQAAARVLSDLAYASRAARLFAEFETNLRRERQLEGSAAAKARGVYRGRPARLEADVVRALQAEDLGATAIAQRLGIGRASVCRLTKPGKGRLVGPRPPRRPLPASAAGVPRPPRQTVAVPRPASSPTAAAAVCASRCGVRGLKGSSRCRCGLARPEPITALS